MIYVVEDDDSIRELVVYTLKIQNFSAIGCENSTSLFNNLNINFCELILLDIMLPDEDGISILKKIKGNSQTMKIPVILLTAKSSEFDKVTGLDLGADDYVTKPFGMMELISRVKALLRRCSKDENNFIYKDLEIDYLKHKVFVKKEEIVLTFKEFEILHLLLLSNGTVLTRDVLLNRIWGFDYSGETRTVDVHVGTLRQKLLSAGDYIETVRGVGYRFGGSI